MRANYLTALIAVTAGVALPAQAQILSKRALLHRCYQQLTQTMLKETDPLLTKVDNGQDPIDVCINDVLKSAFLVNDSTGSYVVPTATRAVGKQVTNTFHLLHSSWFTFRDIPIGGILGYINSNMRGIYEPNAAALYYTMTLLDQTKNADYFLTTNDYLRTLRDQGSPSSSIYLDATNNAIFSNYQGVNLLYQYGMPFGVRILPNAERVFTTTTQDNYPRGRTNYPAGTIKMFENYGGGILGLDIYLARTYDEPVGIPSDGVLEVPRKWSENIYKDIMCRDLPVVRQSDATAFVDPTSDAPFRHATSCTACHVSMDRMAGLIKSITFSERRAQSVWTLYVNPALWNKGAAADYSWSSSKRTTYVASGNTLSNYLREDHVGFLYYRGHDGRLVNEKVDSPTALGLKMSQQIEPYLCAAKRYYRFFTGVDVNIADPGEVPLPMKPQDAVHYNFLLKITKDLIDADAAGQLRPKKMSTLIEAILRSDQYKQQNFGAIYE